MAVTRAQPREVLPEPANNPYGNSADNPNEREIEDEVDSRCYPQAECMHVSSDCHRAEKPREHCGGNNEPRVSKEQCHPVLKADRKKGSHDSNAKRDKQRPMR